MPPLDRLSHRITSRTFAEMNTVDITNALLDSAGISHFENRADATHHAHEISVQYQESDLTYITRLLENEGVHYHFESTDVGIKNGSWRFE